MAELWRHQEDAIDGVGVAIAAGRRRILLTSPTGMGKTRVVFELIRHYLTKGWYAALYSNRRMLIDQLSDNLTMAGIDHGIRAANARDERSKPVQISSIQTEGQRTLTDDEFGGWAIHGVGRPAIVFLDEAHVQTGETARELIRRHVAEGHAVVGVTATPIGLGELYEELIVAGNVGDGRRCGALVMAETFAPDEPDFKRLKKPPVGEDIPPKELRKAFPMSKPLFGRVIDCYRKLNPDGRPAILFASGVKESLWFAEEFTRAGVPAGHIDGDTVWTPTGFDYANRSTRAGLMAASRAGELKVICNRFVMREGIDAPWLSHGIFATTFGSLQTYLQAGGRLLRNDGTGRPVTIQDHGGNYWRHGSLHADRDWHLNDTPATVYGVRAEAFKNRRCRRCWEKVPVELPKCPRCGCPAEREPTVCPKCSRVLNTRTCNTDGCGYVIPLGFRSRMVRQEDGTLREMRGDIFKPDRIAAQPTARQDWVKMYFRALKGKGRITFAQARALYAADHNWGWPAIDWPYMPKDPADLYRRVCDVPKEDLIRHDSPNGPDSGQERPEPAVPGTGVGADD